jgi:hypothetical protein
MCVSPLYKGRIGVNGKAAVKPANETQIFFAGRFYPRSAACRALASRVEA